MFISNMEKTAEQQNNNYISVGQNSINKSISIGYILVKFTILPVQQQNMLNKSWRN